jgi:2-methylcitrate dehydratase PrpD
VSTTEREDASAPLAHAAASWRFKDLPPAAVDAAKRGILDTIAVSLAAIGPAGADVAPVRAWLQDIPASGAVAALGVGWPLSTQDAIFWMGALSHALDYDDYADIVHPSAPVVSAALPLAQEAPVDGRRLITAVAVGQDLVARIALSLGKSLADYGWLPALPGTLGAALGSATLLGLDEDQTRDTIGLALHRTAGTMEALTGVGSAYRAVREGFNAQSGAAAAQLAKRGMRGDPNSLEGEFGLFPQFFEGDYDRDFFLSGLGEELLGPRITFKPWPCAGHTHLYLTAVAEMNAQAPVPYQEVRRITVIGGSAILEQQCEPKSLRTAPPHSIDAKVSIPFLIGKMLRHGTVALDDFSARGLADPDAIALAGLVQWRRDPVYARVDEGFGPAQVDIEMADGTVRSARVEQSLGHPDKPLPWESLVEKFEDCLHVSEATLEPDAATSVVQLISDLEGVEDVAEVTRHLTPAPQG